MIQQYVLRHLKITNRFYFLETVIIVLMAAVPLFFNFPYRVNIFLSWEGAYRIYSGQMPFKDFGLPMGYTYWLIPALFFKLFGPYLASLIKAQVFINIVSGMAFRSILFSFRVKDGVRTMAVLIFCLSYSFFNFWPWYNHSVIVYQLVAFSFLFKYLFPYSGDNKKLIFLYLAGFFCFVTLFTKQDAGGLGLLIAGGVLLINCLLEKKYIPLAHFTGAFIASALIFILPLIPHEFGYWFNYGQEPHNSRLALLDFMVMILGKSQWIKFYLLVIVLLFLHDLKANDLLKQRREVIYYLFIVGILCEALLFQVTSYTPPDNNIFFHSFAIALILSRLPLQLEFSRAAVIIPSVALIFFWWSGVYWKYIKRIADRIVPELFARDPDKISIQTYASENSDAEEVPGMDKWKFVGLKAFNGVYMPENTINGITKLVNSPFLKENKSPRVLNMTELTPLALEMNYELEKGTPLWYHLGVGMFDRELELFSSRVQQGYYDLVLFQEIPNLNNFYPNELNELLRADYTEIDSFRAPRRRANSTIRVYVKEPEKW